MKCLINGTTEPVLFRPMNNVGAPNRTCVLERHRLLHGNTFLPMFDDADCHEDIFGPLFENEDCQVTVTLHDIGQHRNITEVPSNFNLKYFIETHFLFLCTLIFVKKMLTTLLI